MLIREYIDYTFSIKKGRPKIVKLEITEQKLSKIRLAVLNLRLQLREGIYTWVLGPSYETPAEIQDIISLGGNAVGMSTVPVDNEIHRTWFGYYSSFVLHQLRGQGLEGKTTFSFGCAGSFSLGE